MLAVARRMVEGDRMVRDGQISRRAVAHLLGAGVCGKTIGLVGGGGRIGRAVARRAQGFGMRVLYWTPRRKPEARSARLGMTYVPFDELLANPTSSRCIRRSSRRRGTRSARASSD